MSVGSQFRGTARLIVIILLASAMLACAQGGIVTEKVIPQGGANTTNPASNGQAPLAYFPAYIRLKQKTINVDGKQLPVTPGLNVTTEIKTERRTVLEYLLSPIRRTVDESARER